MRNNENHTSLGCFKRSFCREQTANMGIEGGHPYAWIVPIGSLTHHPNWISLIPKNIILTTPLEKLAIHADKYTSPMES